MRRQGVMSQHWHPIGGGGMDRATRREYLRLGRLTAAEPEPLRRTA